MASTTSFNWETPDDTDLVKDGAAAIRTLGNSIDTSMTDLLGGTTGQVLAKASNTNMDFTWVAQDDSNAIQNALLTTTGDTIYASGASTPARLGIGTTGQVLTVSGGVPTWASPAGGGKVLQVVSTTYSTQTTTTSTSFTDTSLSLSITPTASTSKILVIANVPFNVEDASGSFVFGNFNIVRGSTQVWTASTQQWGGEFGAISYVVFCGNASMHYLDSPATTSATTYKIQMQNGNTGQTMRAQAASGTSVLTLMEIGA